MVGARLSSLAERPCYETAVPMKKIGIIAIMCGPLLAGMACAQQPGLVSRDSCRFLAPVAVPARGQKTDDEFGLDMPPPERLFRIESEQAFLAHLRQELPQVKNVQFPRDVPFPPPGQPTLFPPTTAFFVPGVVCHRPIYFTDGRLFVPYAQPVVCATRFYCEIALLPYRMLMAPPWTFECDRP